VDRSLDMLVCHVLFALVWGVCFVVCSIK
jgi:hypothetical protein